LASEDAFQRVLASLAETTEVDHLLYHFVDRFVLGNSPASKRVEG
jgi:hypothetical protein